MKSRLAAGIFCMLASPLLSPTLYAQQAPIPTDLLGKPFLVKKTWIVGGFASYDFLKLDSDNQQLLIARGPSVQVVDIDSGRLAGEIGGDGGPLQEAHAIALDAKGEYGFISDGKGNQVIAYDRQTLQVVAQIPTGPNPRALTYDPASGLIFAVGGAPRSDHINAFLPGPDTTDQQRSRTERISSPEPGSYAIPGMAQTPRTHRQQPGSDSSSQIESVITMIDAENQQTMGTIILQGRAGFAQSDGQGRVYINIVDQGTIVRLDTQRIRTILDHQTVPAIENASAPANPALPLNPTNARVSPAAVLWDFTGLIGKNQPPDGLIQMLPLSTRCSVPEGLAVDARRQRLFVGCGNRVMAVINAETGALITTLPTASGTGVVQYDGSRGLIFVASGDNGGMLTVIRQDVNDSYNLVQNLPTSYRARVLEVNPTTGDIYLASDGGQSEDQGLPSGPTRRPGQSEITNAYPVARQSSFHVLVVSH